MATNCALTSFTATGTTTTETFGDRFARIVNVKDYGAAGDGIADDTAEVQAAIDDAFKPDSSYWLNRPLYFPAGIYNISSTLLAFDCSGSIIIGDGPYASVLQWTGSTGGAAHPLFRADGWRQSRVENIGFVSSSATLAANTIAFDYNWITSPTNSTSVIFSNCRFENATYGMLSGSAGNQCDASIWYNCIFKTCYEGLGANNQNAIECAIIGGRFESCSNVAIRSTGGSFGAIVGVKFLNNNSDNWHSNAGMMLSGCYFKDTATDNNVSGFVTHSLHIIGCVQDSASVKGFVSGSGYQVVDGCYFGTNNVQNTGQYWMRNNSFGGTEVSGSSSLFPLWIWPTGTYATFPTTGARMGLTGIVTDATVNTFGATVNAGGGGNRVKVRHNGTNYTVCGK